MYGSLQRYLLIPTTSQSLGEDISDMEIGRDMGKNNNGDCRVSSKGIMDEMKVNINIIVSPSFIHHSLKYTCIGRYISISVLIEPIYGCV